MARIILTALFALVGCTLQEKDPVYSASPAADGAAISKWNAAHGWGDHRLQGYLAQESDPLFAESIAAKITATQVDDWSSAYGWGDHGAVGYLTAETDPKLGALSSNRVPRWDGTMLVNGSIVDLDGKVGIGNSSPDSLLNVGTVAKLGTDTSVNAKSCRLPSNSWGHTPPSDGACTTFCAAQGLSGGAVVAEDAKSCGGGVCEYIADYETCAISSVPNNGLCNTCASTFTCRCAAPGAVVAGELRVSGGSVGIGVPTPSSALHVAGYVQLDSTAGAPPAPDCDQAAERGRMKIDPATGLLWICANSGWVSK
jgi:hypothetical protein